MNLYEKPLAIITPTDVMLPENEKWRDVRGVTAGVDWAHMRPFEAPNNVGIEGGHVNRDIWVDRVKLDDHPDLGWQAHHAALRLQEARRHGNAEAAAFWTKTLYRK